MAARLFGTNGIREVVGERFTPEMVVRVAGALAALRPPPSRFVVGWDGRTSSPAAAGLVSATLALAGHRVIEVGLLPTPAIQYLVPRLRAEFGVIVTASHNPPEFNGIKCIACDGLEVPRETEEAVERGVAAGFGPTARFDGIGTIERHSSGATEYVEGILSCVDRERIRGRGFSIVLDVGNGASAPTSPALLRALGCRVRTLNAQVDGTFPGRRSEPTEANLVDLRRAVPAFGADLGIAHDGDADRAVFVDRSGTMIPGETMLALLAQDAVRRAGGGVVVSPVTASLSLEEAIRPFGGTVVYTRVGSPNVTREMQRRGAVLGGEENGGTIFPTFQLARDGAMSLAAVLDLLARTGRPLEELVASVPRYAFVREKIACPVDRRAAAVESAARTLAEGAIRVERIDGVKVVRPEGWVLLRPSGTEPLLRVFAEAKDPATAERLAAEAMGALQHALGASAGGP
ncbi:MAG: phosphoglucosamine mutase [Thermoplasmata archaeon]